MVWVNRTPKVVRANRRSEDSRDTRTAHHGWFFHARTGEMIPYKKKLAADFLLVTAIDPDVLKFSTKPEPLQWWNGSTWETYRPRYAIHRAGQPAGVVDVVVDVEVLHGFEYAQNRLMYERLKRDAESKSRRFAVYTEKEIMAEPRYTNALRIFAHAAPRTVPEDDVEAVRAFADANPLFTLDGVIASIGLDFERAYSAVLNLVALGALAIDSSIPFDRRAPIRGRIRR
ncbi:hypothetical protein [Methylosinus sp. RM1]|uniref:hypothetical protein n=1 Tax=Methylosinus sp. RM1 TaxID=2583817 RepID=UPI00140E7323|nr:hypothetical protein [Methylosinus sp. RM1]